MQQGGSGSGSGSGYGVSPETASFVGAHVEAASPISSRPPAQGSFDELGSVAGSIGDEGEELERGVTGNRWPRQETLALLKIRSEMDAAFRDATLKGPLWEDVSRKLADLGYSRSGKKCKEKFENVHKYYKRTKEGRAGRQDGKSYKFFSQLEALHSTSNPPIASTSAPANPSLSSPAMVVSNPAVVISSGGILPPPPPTLAAPTAQINIQPIGPNSSAEPATRASVPVTGISFSSDSSSSSSDSEDEMEEEGPSTGTRKRKRSGSSRVREKMMAFFEGLMRQVMEKQEAMQQRFLEAIEKKEQDRMAREEAWKRQEMARITQEHEIIAQERAMSASRDAAVIAFLQRLTGQTVQIPQLVAIPAAPPTPQPPQLVTIPAAPPSQPPKLVTIPTTRPPPQMQPEPSPTPPTVPQQPPPPPRLQEEQQQEQHKSKDTVIVTHQSSSCEVAVTEQEQQQEMVGVSFDPISSSRWPKSEVLALIKIRSGLEFRYQEPGPKGPLWEEISRGMQQLGFNRSAKRCKEKWENINKYFKKVKESNKKRPEDAKTCPYFHQLDALYQKKTLGSGSSFSSQIKPEQDMNLIPNPNQNPLNQTQAADEAKSSNDNTSSSGGGSSLPVQTSNGGLPPSFFEEVQLKKPEDIVKEQTEQQQAAMDSCDKLEEPDSVLLDQEDGEHTDEEDEDDRRMMYKIQFQRQNTGSSKGGNPIALVQLLLFSSIPFPMYHICTYVYSSRGDHPSEILEP